VHLRRIEEAEDFVRRIVELQPHMSMRVRFLAGNRAAVGMSALFLQPLAAVFLILVLASAMSSELDQDVLDNAMEHAEAIDAELRGLGAVS
jgi:hypothetical protein